MTSATTPPRKRNAALVVLDIVVSIVALLFAFALGLLSVALVTQLIAVAGSCSADTTLTCDPALLTVAGYGLLAVTILGFFLGLGFTIVRLIQRRYTFPFAVGAFVVLVVAFYVASFIAGSAVAPL